MSTPPTEYYSAERWQNWVDRIREEEIDAEDEDSMRVFDLMQDDAAIAAAKIVSSFDDGDLDEEGASEKINEIGDIVFSEPDFDDEDKVFLVGSVQESLSIVLHACMEYIHAGAAEEASIEEYVAAAADAEEEEDIESARGFLVKAGTLIIDGENLSPELGKDLEYGPVAEWLNGLASLQSAMEDPEVVEEDDE
ncbi:DUF2150 family protein [Haloarchaeobius sp. HME9146]|uniref:DUF2150 family protein n=1 Tax=Haloarchaeobius sp. HME9146 TaxID=2978732 RepID=UPI0021C008EE|nr:DUF2150 family protein [Haloarchaeobius sp. HME9146]MCT9097542.1 DUF2150 family protein [Haloarchaeobius sp. HME9146]